MQTIVHRAKDRGKGEYGWLSTRYSFSFANWFEPTRVGFGKLRVINDDVVSPAHGFDMHSHRDMEIVTLVMRGAVTHEDSMGNRGVVEAGDIQAMSAGTGVTHAERNESPDEPLELFQIWIETDAPGHAPRYAQCTLPAPEPPPSLSLLVSPDGREKSLPVHQDAFLYRGLVTPAAPLQYRLQDPAHGAYVFVIDGTIEIADQKLGARDAMGILDTDLFMIAASEPSTLLVIEVPM